MLLREAIPIDRERIIALVGGGGKTTTMFTLAAELAASGRRVVVGTTTKILPPEPDQSPKPLIGKVDAAFLDDLRRRLDEHPIQTVAPRITEKGKLDSLDDAMIEAILRDSGADHVIVEADGSLHKPFKAPAEYEPVIPTTADVVLAVVGLSVLGRPLEEVRVHRADLVTALTGSPIGSPVTEWMVAQVMTHPRGLAKGAPPTARVIPQLNQAEDPARAERALVLADLLLARRVPQVLVTAVQHSPIVRDVIRPKVAGGNVAAVVLAAGESKRLGTPKQLIELAGEPLVARTVRTALGSSADLVVVVVGHEAAAVQAVLPADPRLIVVENHEYLAGQGTSIAAAVRALPAGCVAEFQVVCDQPFLTPEILDRVIGRFRRTGAPVVTVRHGERRGTPTLWASRLFRELLALNDDQGGKPVLRRHFDEISWVELDSAEPLRDVDTPEDVRALRA